MTKKSSVELQASSLLNQIRNLEISDPEVETIVDATVAYVAVANRTMKDLTKALSKADRVNAAYKDMIEHVAVKNSGLKHKIRNLQKFIAKLKSGEVPLSSGEGDAC